MNADAILRAVTQEDLLWGVLVISLAFLGLYVWFWLSLRDLWGP